MRHSLPRAAALLLAAAFPLCALAQPAANPCSTDERFRAFDFWIGEWEVTNPQGQVAGTNRVESRLNGCILQENWTGNGGSTGTSLNYLDVTTGRWHQLWTDGRGGHMRYEGAFTDGAMRFEGTNVYGNGQTTLMRMTFTPLEDGRVRQFIEESRDEGATWNVWFDGYYAKATPTR